MTEKEYHQHWQSILDDLGVAAPSGPDRDREPGSASAVRPEPPRPAEKPAAREEPVPESASEAGEGASAVPEVPLPPVSPSEEPPVRKKRRSSTRPAAGETETVSAAPASEPPLSPSVEGAEETTAPGKRTRRRRSRGAAAEAESVSEQEHIPAADFRPPEVEGEARPTASRGQAPLPEVQPAPDEFPEERQRVPDEEPVGDLRSEVHPFERGEEREVISVDSRSSGRADPGTEQEAIDLEEPWLEGAEDSPDTDFAEGLGEESLAEEVPPQAEGGGKRKRRRRRGRKNDQEREMRPSPVEEDLEEEAAPEELDEEVYASDEEPAVAEEEEDEDLVLDLTNWNVPTWAELVAGLYRPER